MPRVKKAGSPIPAPTTTGYERRELAATRWDRLMTRLHEAGGIGAVNEFTSIIDNDIEMGRKKLEEEFSTIISGAAVGAPLSHPRLMPSSAAYASMKAEYVKHKEGEKKRMAQQERDAIIKRAKTPGVKREGPSSGTLSPESSS